MAVHIHIHRKQVPALFKKRKAAGVLWFSQQGRVLLLKRAEGSDHGGTWGFPAGGIEPGETAMEAARRELREETQCMQPPNRLVEIWDDEQFTLFLINYIQFTPILNHEHTDFTWAYPTSLPKPLHPNVEEQIKAATLYRKALLT